MIFGHLLTSSNNDDNVKKTIGGRNGYGAKLTNIFSTEFIIETANGKRLKKYVQVYEHQGSRNPWSAVKYLNLSVLVHNGGVHGGHYYAFIRPTVSNQWYKFDDERVTKEDMKKALEELYGDEEEHTVQTNPGLNNTPFKFTKHSNAYMLVYIRESDKDKIVCHVDEKDIAEHLTDNIFVNVVASIQYRALSEKGQ
ncbi:hypothetical protein OROGR_009169 [Orobanche gracilis]